EEAAPEETPFPCSARTPACHCPTNRRLIQQLLEQLHPRRIEGDDRRRGVPAGPAPGLLIIETPLALVQPGGVVADGVVEDGDDGQEDCPYREIRPPPPPEDVQRHLPLRADVGMVHLGFEGELDGLEGVVLGVGDVDGERAAGVGAVVGAVPVKQVRHGRRAGPAERRRVHPELFQLLADPPDHRGRLRHGRCRRSCA
uniref:Uncharacterized protein n=1 Tax=Triticum urartu TaxID=4572 RepID=A0A8R7VEY1_TRIUA